MRSRLLLGSLAGILAFAGCLARKTSSLDGSTSGVDTGAAEASDSSVADTNAPTVDAGTGARDAAGTGVDLAGSPDTGAPDSSSVDLSSIDRTDVPLSGSGGAGGIDAGGVVGSSGAGGVTGSGGGSTGGALGSGGIVTTGGALGSGGTSGCAGACCSNADCPGACQMCSASHTCVAVINADDPNGRCTGTCDATGACKASKGQACTAQAGGCVSGTVCAPEGICCDKACTGSCEACDLSGALGTCTTLGAGATPHSGHSQCEATDVECAGKCNGTSNACFYTTAGCGSAACSGSTYTPAGTCSSGACVAGTTQPCPTNESCSGTACACSPPNQTCSGSCVNTNTDAANCGSCGHSCGTGSTCFGGQCQPIVMASGLGGYSFVFGVDGSYVYYNNCSDYYTCTPLRIALGAVGATGSPLTSLTCSGGFVIGNTMLLHENQVADFLCNIGSTCSPTASNKLAAGVSANFKSPSPSYFALSNWNNSTTEVTTWYTTDNVAQSMFTWSYQGDLSNFAAVGNFVYWTESVKDSGGNTIGYLVRGTVGFPASATNQLAGGIPSYLSIVDANSKSLIYQDPSTKYLYRVPLPGGMGTSAPQNIAGGTATKFVTEEINGIYWIDSTGNVNRCVAPSCSASATMATGQILGNYAGLGSFGALYQDSTSLYWINGLGQLIKLAK